MGTRMMTIGAIGVAFVWIGVIREEMGDVEGENYDSLLRNLTNANTMLLNDASETLEFNSIDALDQVHCIARSPQCEES